MYIVYMCRYIRSVRSSVPAWVIDRTEINYEKVVGYCMVNVTNRSCQRKTSDPLVRIIFQKTIIDVIDIILILWARLIIPNISETIKI